MNRKIARDSAGAGFQPTEYSEQPQKSEKTVPVLRGTPVQQLWQITNWHETRLKKVDAFLSHSSAEKHLTMLGVNQNRRDIEVLKEQNARLEAELAAIKKHLVGNASTKGTKKGKGVTLEVTEA